MQVATIPLPKTNAQQPDSTTSSPSTVTSIQPHLGEVLLPVTKETNVNIEFLDMSY